MSNTQKVKVILWGCGNMGQIMVNYLLQKNVQIVGAIDRNPARVGKDLGDVANLGYKLNIKISSDHEAVLSSSAADLCIVATRSTMEDVYPQLEAVVNHGINVLTICEEAFYSWNTNPELSNTLDALARKNNCTVTASGIQDIYYVNLAAIIASSTQKIDRIYGLSTYNVDDYGQALAQVHGVGLSEEQFKQDISSNTAPSFGWNAGEALASRLGMTIKSIHEKKVPVYNKQGVYSKTMGTTLGTNQAAGMKSSVFITTYQGTVIEFDTVGKVYEPGEIDVTNWSLEGEPTTTVNISSPATPQLTCATIVNRIPHVLDAPAGFYTIDKLPSPEFHHFISKSL